MYVCLHITMNLDQLFLISLTESSRLRGLGLAIYLLRQLYLQEFCQLAGLCSALPSSLFALLNKKGSKWAKIIVITQQKSNKNKNSKNLF